MYTDFLQVGSTFASHSQKKETVPHSDQPKTTRLAETCLGSVYSPPTATTTSSNQFAATLTRFCVHKEREVTFYLLRGSRQIACGCCCEVIISKHGRSPPPPCNKFAPAILTRLPTPLGCKKDSSHAQENPLNSREVPNKLGET